jgi:tetratricopeptide (TPR) repeat protein
MHVMARDGLVLIACAGLCLGAVAAVPAGPPEDAKGRIETHLAVQRALQQGRACLQRGNYEAAVQFLEGEVARINGDRDFLLTLRDAYRGYVRELSDEGRSDEARIYQNRLQLIDPGAHMDSASSPNPAVAPAAAPKAAEHLSAPAIASVASTAVPQTKPASPQSAAAGFTSRGAMPTSDDPFADSNRAPKADTVGLAQRAAEEFAKGRYTAAGKLYDQAHQSDPHNTDKFKEQWAYCKLYAVVESLNHSEGAAPPDLEAEVRKALALTAAPKLEVLGKDLLRRIQERRGTSAVESSSRIVEVRHTPAQGTGWAVAETTSFRILHRQSVEFAEQVARAAEQARAAASQKWFGDVPVAWSPRCDLCLHATSEDYSRETRAPRWSPGHSTMKQEGERVTIRRIDLRCDDPHLLDAVLPHEVTHIVLCGRFGRQAVPRWADEGMAVLMEPRSRIELHLRNLPGHRQEHTLFSVGQILEMTNYPDARSIGPFYAQSVSLVEFLSTQAGGPQIFGRFLRDGMAHGYDKALRQHYSIEGFADLQQRWEKHAFGNAATVQLTEQTR